MPKIRKGADRFFYRIGSGGTNTGGGIVIPDKEDRPKILDMINSRAKGKFSIDDKTGKLYIIEKDGSDGYSEYYRDRLIEAINKQGKEIEIRIGNIIKTLTYNMETDTFIPEEGGEFDSGDVINNTEEYGGGVNWGYFNGNQLVFISGKGYLGKGITDNNGNMISYEAADILLHELLGHAIPKLVGSDTGNAIENENKAITELGKILRFVHLKHIE